MPLISPSWQLATSAEDLFVSLLSIDRSYFLQVSSYEQNSNGYAEILFLWPTAPTKIFELGKVGRHWDTPLSKSSVSWIPSLLLTEAQPSPFSKVPKEASYRCFCLFIPLLPDMGIKTDRHLYRVRETGMSQWNHQKAAYLQYKKKSGGRKGSLTFPAPLILVGIYKRKWGDSPHFQRPAIFANNQIISFSYMNMPWNFVSSICQPCHHDIWK